MSEINKQLKDLNQSRVKFFDSTSQFEELVQQLHARQADFDSIRMGEPEIPRYLKAFSNLTPENVYLNKLATKYVSETDEEKDEEETGQVDAPIQFKMESVMSSFTKSFGDPLSAA